MSTTSPTSSYSTPQWWKESVVYQIYPSSFQSHAGNKTGWGSIKGITSRVDYLKSLGVDIVWSSPFLKSPQVDMGYDTADYEDVDARYGTLDDVDNLIGELKKREMKLMIDLVVNHTSDQHQWFRDSRSSKQNPKRDWYIWRKPKSIGPDGVPEPPNNWAQILGEANSGWKYDPDTAEFYLCLFSPEQPDLNWENAEVRAAVWDVMHFWLKRGACGFRLDVINMISKVPHLPDADVTLPGHKYQPCWKHVVNGPRLHEYMRAMHREVLSKYDTITVGEMPGISDEDEILKTVGAKSDQLRMIFNFDLVDIDKGSVRMMLNPWDVKDMKSIIAHWQRVMIDKDGWNSVFIENHDNPRSVSRYADDSDEFRQRGATLLALMQTTLGGTLFLYQGEEIGMRNAPTSWSMDEFKDIETVNFWKKCQRLYADDPDRLAHGRKIIDAKARDHARTPMQWTATENAGFCDADVKPWMRVMDDYDDINVESQMAARQADDTLSVWQFWQRALADRKEHADVFVYGDFAELSVQHADIFAYVRTSATGERWVVALNFSGNDVTWHVPDELAVEFWARGNYGKGRPAKPLEGTVTLHPWEAILGKSA